MLAVAVLGLALLGACGGDANPAGDGGNPPSDSGPPSDGGNPPDSATAADCLNREVYRSGTRVVMEVRTVGTNVDGTPTAPVEYSSQTDTLGAAIFQGQETTEFALSGSGGSISIYRSLDGDRDLQHGATTPTGTTIFDPPRLYRFDLSPGEAYEQDFVETFEDLQGAVVQTSNIHDRHSYLGRETVTVPAGTFANACKFSYESRYVYSTGAQVEQYCLSWSAAGSGLSLKQECGPDADTVTTSYELLGASIDGVPVVP